MSQTLLEPTEFARLVVDAVAHIYDQPYLQVHPLVQILVAEPRGVLRGQALQRTLLDTIQALKPPPGTVDCAHAWRTYRYLFLRYVQALSVADVAGDLGISERQARRTYREAFDALTSVLWDRYREQAQLALGSDSPGRPGPGFPSLSHPDASQPGSVGPTLRDGPKMSSDPVLLSEEVRHLAAEHQDESTDLAEVIAGLRSILDPLATRHGCAWSAILEETLGPIRGDRVILRQILLNLCVAAFERGAPRLRLTAGRSAEWIRIELLGSGDRTPRKAPTEGAHVDCAQRLATCRLLVEAQGGTFADRSTKGDSPAWEVCLPPSRRPNVLVVDDNPEIRTVFRRYLESAGADVLTAESGARGFALAQEVRPAAVTLDVMMASQDGWETLQLLRNHPTTHDIPVIICSVLRDAELSGFLGAAELLPKPILRADLLAALSRCGVRGLGGADQSSS